ncbi:unnamed protein product [Psylliodes chrysocephalus]|uniref:Uncharacterized protein n=1 Tax=Psylliodes chrysocephalus TaxID=3402493 RepID=A0A9P0D0H3_9CUCU|nr:unnamed protein product [Psylliodes chrysocephala]
MTSFRRRVLSGIQIGLLPSRLHGALVVHYFSVFNSFFEFFLSLTSDDNDVIERCTKCIEDELTKLTDVLKENTLKKPNDFFDKRKSMEVAVNCVEVLSVSSVACAFCSELIKPLQAKKGKRKHPEPKGKDHVQRISDKLKSEMNSFCDILQDFVDASPEETL